MINQIRQTALDAIRKRGIQIKRMPPALIQNPEHTSLELTLEHVVARHLLDPDPDFFFVQVGAFDGVTQDQLHDLVLRYGWPGILVEPQPAAFNALRRTYAGVPGLTFRNVAISKQNETRGFYSIIPGPTIPGWADQLASFDPKIILRHGTPAERKILGENLACSPVECVTFESLLTDVARVDLLQIDAEGYDGTFIDRFDFERWQPSIVRFEHKHLTRVAHDAAIRRLLAYGYRVTAGQVDTVAYREPTPGTRRSTPRQRSDCLVPPIPVRVGISCSPQTLRLERNNCRCPIR